MSAATSLAACRCSPHSRPRPPQFPQIWAPPPQRPNYKGSRAKQKPQSRWGRLLPVPAPSTLHYTQNTVWHSQSQAQPITWCSKVLVRAPYEQSKDHERLERMRSREGNLLVAAIAIGTAAARASCDASTRSPPPPLRVCRPVEKGWGGSTAKGGRDRTQSRCCGKVQGRYRGMMQTIVATVGRTFEAGARRYVKVAYGGDDGDRLCRCSRHLYRERGDWD